MNIREITVWTVELNESDSTIVGLNNLNRTVDSAEGLAEGSLSICADNGPRPWWQRMFGPKRFIVSYFALEWFGGYASLIFHDENWGEYRSIDKGVPANPPESVRLKIAHGELQPHPTEECLDKARAFAAVRHLIQTGQRPDWLTYRYVR